MTFAAGLTLGNTWLILLYIRREWNQQADKLLPEVETGLELDRDLSFIIPSPYSDTVSSTVYWCYVELRSMTRCTVRT